MIKQADINQLLGGLKDTASDAGGALKDWFANLSPDTKSTMVRGLAGAAVGGAAGHYLTPDDPDPRHKPVMSPALLGALLGGGAAAAIPAGLKMMGNGIKFESEHKRPLGLRMAEKPGDIAMNNPLATALPAFAAWKARDAFGNMRNAVTSAEHGAVADVTAPLHRRVPEALMNQEYWHTPRDIRFRPLSDKAIENGLTGIRGGRGRMAAIPLALLAGLAGDKYLKGQW